ncbi:MAG: hypothetical protein WC657_00350 [Candidatus Paceibacterota bacterium]|jgi:hypothetical protein
MDDDMRDDELEEETLKPKDPLLGDDDLLGDDADADVPEEDDDDDAM